MKKLSINDGLNIRKAVVDDVPEILDFLELMLDGAEQLTLPDPMKGWVVGTPATLPPMIIENRWHFFIMETTDHALMCGLSIINRDNFAKQLYLSPSVVDTTDGEYFSSVADAAASGLVSTTV